MEISRESKPDQSKAELMSHAIRANVRISANQLRHGSDIIEKLVDEQGLMIVGAEYSLETGKVEFFEGV